MAIDSLYFSSSLVLNFDGADTSTTFTDISVSPKTPTVNGAAQIATAQYQTGAASMSLASASSSYLSYASDPSFDFGSDDFCVEFWWRPASAGTDYGLIHYSTPSISANTDIAFGISHLGSSGAGKISAFICSGSTAYTIPGLSALSATTWYHIALSRSSGIMSLWVDGILQGQTSANVSINTPASRAMRVGQYHSGSTKYANGFMDGLRITKGAARYTSSFTPSTESFEITPPATGVAEITLPSIALDGYGGGYGQIEFPALTVAGYSGATAAISLPMPTLYAVGHDATGENSLRYVLPMLAVSGYGGATATMSLPALLLEASGITTIVGRATIVLPALEGSATGTTTVSGSLTANLPKLSVSANGGATLSDVLPSILASGSGLAGAVGHSAITLPMLQVLATATAQAHGSAEITLPMLVMTPTASAVILLPSLQVHGEGREVVTITYEAYAINLKPGNRAGVHEVSHYTNWPFDGIVRHGSRYYAWGPAGLFEIGGATDYNAATPLVPTPIPWDWMTTVTDFGSSQKKAMRQMAIGGRIGPNVVAKVATGREADYSYRYSTSRGQKAQNYRVKLGKGLDDRYYSFGLSGTGEGDVDTIDIDVETLSRKI